MEEIAKLLKEKEHEVDFEVTSDCKSIIHPELRNWNLGSNLEINTWKSQSLYHEVMNSIKENFRICQL